MGDHSLLQPDEGSQRAFGGGNAKPPRHGHGLPKDLGKESCGLALLAHPGSGSSATKLLLFLLGKTKLEARPGYFARCKSLRGKVLGKMEKPGRKGGKEKSQTTTVCVWSLQKGVRSQSIKASAFGRGSKEQAQRGSPAGPPPQQTSQRPRVSRRASATKYATGAVKPCSPPGLFWM